MSNRVQNWPSVLEEYIEQRLCSPFAWGTQDCCQFALGAVIRLTGRDPSQDLKFRRYRTAAAAQANLDRLGGVAALPEKVGLVPVPIGMAGRGDVVLLESEGRELLGVCIGVKTVAPGENGLAFVDTLSGLRAWRT